MPNSFTLKIRSGHFTKDVKRLVERHCDAGIKQGGLEVHAAEIAVTPIDKGRLRMGWDITQPKWHGNVRRVSVENQTPYARIVDARSKRNHGYIGRGFDKGRGPAMGKLKQAARELAPHLWVKK